MQLYLLLFVFKCFLVVFFYIFFYFFLFFFLSVPYCILVQSLHLVKLFVLFCLSEVLQLALPFGVATFEAHALFIGASLPDDFGFFFFSLKLRAHAQHGLMVNYVNVGSFCFFSYFFSISMWKAVN